MVAPLIDYPAPGGSGGAGQRPVGTFGYVLDRLRRRWRRWQVEHRVPIVVSLGAGASVIAAAIALWSWPRHSPALASVEKALPYFTDATSTGPSRGAPTADAGGLDPPTTGTAVGRALGSGPPALGAFPSSTSTQPQIAVDVAGAVRQSGLHWLRLGARVDDAIIAAGGPAGSANLDALNLAALLGDGSRIYVPTKGETSPPAVIDVQGPSPGSNGPGAVAGSSSGQSPATGLAALPVDLNTATAEQLDALPGVGPATASAILEYRAAHGRFKAVTELLEVRGIGEAKLAALRPKVRI